MMSAFDFLLNQPFGCIFLELRPGFLPPFLPAEFKLISTKTCVCGLNSAIFKAVSCFGIGLISFGIGSSAEAITVGKKLTSASSFQDGAVLEKPTKKKESGTQDLAVKEAPPKADFNRAVQIESFEKVWKTVKESHWDPEISGENWDEIRKEFLPKIESCDSDSEARKIMGEMLERLNQSHFGIIPNTSYEAMEKQMAAGGSGYSGLVVRLVQQQLVVTRVRENSPAQRAGVNTGWVIKRIEGEETDQVLTDEQIIARAKKATDHSVMRWETAVGLVSDAVTTGPIGKTLTITFLDESDKNRVVELKLVKGPGVATKFGNLPTINVEFESKRLDGDIGYIAFNAFFNPPQLITGFRKAVTKEYNNSNGLIIDMRGNRGGMVGLTMGMSGWFIKERKSLGVMQMKQAPLNLSINPRRPAFQKPVVVLVDECSISAAEVWAGGLKDIGIARVIGQRSAGLVLPSNVSKLPNGDGFQYAIADYHSASGDSLERDGVMPDQVISLQRETLFGNQDPVVNAATKWILKQSKQGSNK